MFWLDHLWQHKWSRGTIYVRHNWSSRTTYVQRPNISLQIQNISLQSILHYSEKGLNTFLCIQKCPNMTKGRLLFWTLHLCSYWKAICPSVHPSVVWTSAMAARINVRLAQCACLNVLNVLAQRACSTSACSIATCSTCLLNIRLAQIYLSCDMTKFIFTSF